MLGGLTAGKSWIGWLTLVAMVLLIGGCPPPIYKDYDSFMKKPRPIVGGKPYVIEPPDTLRLIAPSVPEVDEISLTVRPDGYVTVFLLGDVFVAGKTPTQLASELEEKLLRYYEDVTVQVEVTGFNSKVYYMAGETSAGRQAYTGKDTILDAVIGKIPRTAWPEYCVVLRPNEEGELIRRMTINLRDMYERGDLKYNAVLEEGDIVYIPINPLAAVGVVVQNILQPVSPVLQATQTPRQVASTAFTGGLVP
ncbi:MAG: polysaccharide biosynthesis/export family protein [Phycisphaeraceae bacterium]